MTAKRTPLSGLGQRLAKKPDAEPPLQVEPESDLGPARADQSPDTRKGILVRARPEAWKALKIIALDRDLTLQDLMTEAVNDVLVKHGRPPTA